MQRQQARAEPGDGPVGYLEVNAAEVGDLSSRAHLGVVLPVGKIDLGHSELLIPRDRISQRPPARVEYLDANTFSWLRIGYRDRHRVERLPIERELEINLLAWRDRKQVRGFSRFRNRPRVTNGGIACAPDGAGNRAGAEIWGIRGNDVILYR